MNEFTLKEYTQEEYKADMQRLLAEKGLPSVTPQEPRWIPITERLPEKEEYVLCWLRYGDYMIAKWKYKEWTSEDEVIWVDGNLGTGTFDVVAWMPLPKAYR